DDTILFHGPPSSAAEPAAGGASPAPTAPLDEPAVDDDAEPELPPAIGDVDVFDRALPTLATVTTDGPGGLRGGSAVFIADDLVATCRHLFDDATSASLTFPDARERVEALTIVAENTALDLAIVRLIRPEHARPARLPVEDAPSAQRVIVIGDPLGLGPTLTAAAMDAPASPVSFAKAIAPTDAMLGSPVFDERGQLIGIVTRPDEPAIVDAAHIAATNATPLVKPRSVANEPKTR
ncbi:MAG TPA: serine protease, partial [Polyangiaceae bacterium]|nr:serine protease [Polyangiaceae bacterium]